MTPPSGPVTRARRSALGLALTVVCLSACGGGSADGPGEGTAASLSASSVPPSTPEAATVATPAPAVSSPASASPSGTAPAPTGADPTSAGATPDAGAARFVSVVRANVPEVADGRTDAELAAVATAACTGLRGGVDADTIVATTRSLDTLDAEAVDEATARELIKLAIDTSCLDQASRVDEFRAL